MLLKRIKEKRKGEAMLDSLKTVATGTGGLVVTWMEWLPIAIRCLIGVATFVYVCVKIYKETKGD